MKDSIVIQLIDSKGNVQYGLNWGHRDNRNPNQAYVQLPPEVYKGPFFPKKGRFFAVKTDDGQTIIMTRAQKTDDGTALQTPDDNSIFGRYIRKRLGLEEGALITTEDILKYGRTNIVFTKLDELNFVMDFNNGHSVKNNSTSIDQPLQLIYYGAPGTGKSFTIDKETDESNSVRTTFHPDSDYAGFVGAYKPTMAPMPVNAFVGTTVHHAKNSKDELAFEKKIVYKYVPQAFLKAYVEAWKRYSPTEDNPYYLVIEEINRGNCAQIFGDLFQLLDRNNHGSSSYAISADQDIAQFLKDDENGFAGLSQEQRDVISNFVLKKDSGNEENIGASILDGSKLLLPPNMRIWATMNTSDQSLFPIDSAFKRRWNWEYMPIEYNKKDWTFSVGGKRYSWGEFLKYINPKIYELTQSEDKQMGYFFAKPDKKSNEDLQENDVISTKVFVNKVLFYLWTDVFKDYDLTQEPFVYEDEENNIKKAYRFTDFFPIENNQKLINFVEGLKLEDVNNNLIDTEFIEETPTDSTTQEKNKKLWAAFFDYVKTNDEFKDVFNVNRTPSKDSWMDFTIGLPNVWLNVQQLRTKSKVRISLVVRIKAAVNSIFEMKKGDLELKLSEITGLNVGYKQTSQNNIVSFEFENKDFDTLSTSNHLFKLIADNLVAAQSVAKEILS